MSVAVTANNLPCVKAKDLLLVERFDWTRPIQSPYHQPHYQMSPQGLYAP